MLAITDRATATCLVIEVSGAVEGAEYEPFTQRFEQTSKDNGEVNSVVNLTGPVHYGDLDAFKDDWRFAFKQYREAKRAALVGEQHAINTLMRLFQPFMRVEERIFPEAELDAAIAWASGS